MQIKLDSLVKEYKNSDGTVVRAVDNVSLQIPENKIFFFILKKFFWFCGLKFFEKALLCAL